jgi:hypothetical protein
VSERFNAATVCLSVRVSPERAELLRAYAVAHRVTVQAVLGRCVDAAIDVLREVAAPHLVTSEEAAGGASATHRLRVAAEGVCGE